MRNPLLWAWCLVLLSSFPASAQYYAEEEIPASGNRFFAVGPMWRTFEPRKSITRPDSTVIRFKRVMPLISYSQGEAEFYFGYTTFGPDNSRTAVTIGASIASDLSLTGSRTSALTLPILLAADYTKATAGGLQRDDFNIGSIGLGAGLRYRWSSPRTQFWVEGAGIIHVAFEGFMGRSGSSAATVAETGLLLRGIGIGDGLVVTYRFRHQSWGGGGGLFDYRSVYHGPSVGILF